MTNSGIQMTQPVTTEPPNLGTDVITEQPSASQPSMSENITSEIKDVKSELHEDSLEDDNYDDDDTDDDGDDGKVCVGCKRKSGGKYWKCQLLFCRNRITLCPACNTYYTKVRSPYKLEQVKNHCNQMIHR